MAFVFAFAALTGCKKSSNSPAETQASPAPQTETTAPATNAPETESTAPQTTAPQTDSSKTYFDQTSMYTTIVELVDQNFASYKHQVMYNRDSESLFLVFEAPANTRAGLESKNSNVMEAWQKVVDGFSTLSTTFYDSLHATYGVEHVLVYMVEEIKSGNYVASDIFLYIDKGVVTVNAGQ